MTVVVIGGLNGGGESGAIGRWCWCLGLEEAKRNLIFYIFF